MLSGNFIDETWTDEMIFGILRLDVKRPHNIYVSNQFSIVRRTSKGVAYFQVSDMRNNGRTVNTVNKRQATRVAKLIEKAHFNS